MFESLVSEEVTETISVQIVFDNVFESLVSEEVTETFGMVPDTPARLRVL